jgi:O-antigen ligase
MATSLQRAHPTTDATRVHAAAALFGGGTLAAVIAAMPGWSGVLTALWVALAVAIRRLPVLGLAALALVVPLEQRYLVPTAIGALSPSHYVGWALVAALLPGAISRRRVVVDPVAVTLALVVVALAASIGAGEVRVGTWWLEVLRWTLFMLVYVSIRSLPLTPGERALVLAGVGGGVITASGPAFVQAVTGAGPESFQVGGLVRVYGTFTHPNTLAAFLGLSLPPLAMVALMRGGWVTWLARIAGSMGIVALVLTQSRAGWLAFGTAGLVMLALSPRRVQRVAALAVASVVVLAVVIGIATDLPGAQRFGSVAGPGDGSVQVTTETWGQLERQAHWGAAWSMLASDPVFGVGAAEFNDNFREHTPDWRYRVGRGTAHNGYLHLGAQAGVPGLLTYSAWVGTILLALGRRIARSSGIDALLAVGALGTAIAYAVDSMFEYLDVSSLHLLLVVVVALGLGGATRSSRSDRMHAFPRTGAAT